METTKTNVAKPKAKVVGEDGNIFVTLGICSRALRKAGQIENDEKMNKRVFASSSYHEALAIMQEYVDMV